VTAAPDWPLPPHVIVPDFLAPEQHAAVLEWVLGGRDRFKDAEVRASQRGTGDRVDPAVRIALVSRKFGPLREALEARLLAVLPDVMKAIGAKGPEPRSLELELAAHGNGAHFTAHYDISIGEGRQSLGANDGEDRVLSAVLYFHREPSGFQGGHLRLYRLGTATPEQQADPANFIDIEPVQNSLVVFPSWVSHEVMPVTCPSGEFADYRFALNCWFCRAL
jgi:Rps23 Pro-64 3,4-dihydroxylase Tpa1-like proline 4-hydroxylase